MSQVSEQNIAKIQDNIDGNFLSQLSLIQDLTFCEAEEIFAKEYVNFDPSQMKAFGLLRPDGCYTNLALILSDQNPYTTKVVTYEGTTQEVLAFSKEFTGSVLKQIEEVPDYIARSNGSKGGPLYPPEALQEAFTNAIAHRNYGIEGSIVVSMHSKYVDIMSPGGMVPGVTQDLLGFGVYATRGKARDLETNFLARNENLAKILHELGFAEGCGSGIPRIYEAYSDSILTPQIAFVDGGFLIRLPDTTAPIWHGNDHMPHPEDQVESHPIEALHGDSFTAEEVAKALDDDIELICELLECFMTMGLLGPEE